MKKIFLFILVFLSTISVVEAVRIHGTGCLYAEGSGDATINVVGHTTVSGDFVAFLKNYEDIIIDGNFTVHHYRGWDIYSGKGRITVSNDDNKLRVKAGGTGNVWACGTGMAILHGFGFYNTTGYKIEVEEEERERRVKSDLRIDIRAEEEVGAGDYLDMYVKTKNIGDKERINLKVVLPDLDIYETSYFNLVKNQGKWRVFNLEIPDDAKRGEYIVRVMADDGRDNFIEYKTFNVV